MLSRAAHPSRWTVADVPLLDEAAELLGVDDSAAKAARRELERAQRLEAKYAQEVLDVTGVADLGMVDAETLAAWNRDNGPSLSTAERAAADRSWAYGHVIIDEAQELSAMAWRMVLRRNPSRSMTVVGDVAQTGSPAGARSWKEMLTPLVGARWREERLTVNYRTPAEIMTVAADVLASVAPAERPPDSVRSEGVPPRAVQVPARANVPARESRPADANVPARETLAASVARIARADLAELGGPDGGRLAVIAPDAPRRRIAAAAPRGDPRRPPRVPRRGRHPAHGLAGQGPRVRPGGAGRPVRRHRPVAQRRPRPLRGHHPRYPPPDRRPRGPAPRLAPLPDFRRLTPSPHPGTPLVPGTTWS